MAVVKELFCLLHAHRRFFVVFLCIWVTRRYLSGIDERGLTVEDINSLMKFVDTDVSYSLDIAELR